MTTTGKRDFSMAGPRAWTAYQYLLDNCRLYQLSNDI